MRDPITASYLAAVGACLLIVTLRLYIAWLHYTWRQRILDLEPRCATCGYIVAKCTSAICPECGRDVREHGLITSRAPPKVRMAPLYILMALIPLPLAIPVGTFLAMHQPLFGWTYYYTQMVSLPHNDPTASGLLRYAVQSEGTGRFFSKKPKYIWIYCNTEGSGDLHPMLVVDLRTKQLAVMDSTGHRSEGQPIDIAPVYEFLRVRSPSVPDAQLLNASQRVLSAIQTEMIGNFSTSGFYGDDPWNGTSLSYSVADRVSIAIVLLSGVLLSMLLVVATWRLNKSRLHKLRGLWHQEFDRLSLGR